MKPFCPVPASTVNIDVASSSARAALTGISGMTQVRVMNNGTATAWIEFGGSAVAAALATGIPIGAGVTEVHTTAQSNVAAIAAGSTGKIYFTLGQGF